MTDENESLDDSLEDEPTLRVAILGAGPVGLEAALYARFLGYEATIFEQGEVCQNLRAWGHVKLFSPFQMNHTPLGAAAILAQQPDWRPPSGDSLLTGRELLEQYFQPLADSDLLADNLLTQTKVLSVTRPGLLKGDLVGDSRRGDFEFRILVKNKEGVESEYAADVVIDATGTYGQPNWMGQGGGPAIGERGVRRPCHKNRVSRLIEYGLPDILGADRDRYVNHRTLVVGAGYSAATTIASLQELASKSPKTKVLWATRTDSEEPIGRLENDRLSHRDELAEKANKIAQRESSAVAHKPGVVVTRIDHVAGTTSTGSDSSVEPDAEGKEANGFFRVELTNVAAPGNVPLAKDESSSEIVEVDRIVANVGYRTDGSFTRELQIPTCYATDGPLRLAAALAGEESKDCLDQSTCGPETLTNPEPNFYILGAKSYGRASNFLLATGFEQIREVFTLIGESEDLDLYRSIQATRK